MATTVASAFDKILAKQVGLDSGDSDGPALVRRAPHGALPKATRTVNSMTRNSASQFVTHLHSPEVPCPLSPPTAKARSSTSSPP